MTSISPNLHLCAHSGQMRWTGPVQPMNIGSGESDTISVPGVGRAAASITRAPDGSHQVKSNERNGVLFDANSREVDCLTLSPGVRFRIGEVHFECLEAGPNAPLGGDWKSLCPFCGHPVTEPPAAAAECAACGESIRWLREDPGNQGDGRAGHAPWAGWVPASLGGFQLRAFQGQGGMGVVFRGLDGADRLAAVKLIQSKNPSPSALKAFSREIELLDSLPPHPNVIRLLAHGSEHKLRWLAMEWNDGSTLAWKLRSKRDAAATGSKAAPPLGIAEIGLIMSQLAKGLLHLHENGVIHRDLKPANIFLREDNSLKIADFGIARPVDGRTLQTTMTGTSGSPLYMAPEIHAGAVATRESDLYALGLIWQEMLTGANTGGLLRIERKDCPAEWRECIERLLSISPEERPDLASVINAINKLPSPSPALPSKPENGRPKPRRVLRTAATLIALSLLVGAFFLWKGQRHSEPNPAEWSSPADQSDSEPNPAKWSELAHQGDPFAQALLARSYLRGTPPYQKNLSTAEEWARKSADNKHPLGLFILADILLKKHGDSLESESLISQAVNAGFFTNPTGGAWLAEAGSAYLFGTGVPKDEEKGVALPKQAAEAGDTFAMVRLAYAHRDGVWGLDKDAGKAVEWLKKAVEMGDADAMHNLGVAHYLGIMGLKKDDRKAVEWWQKAAEKGSSSAMRSLGNAYRNGIGGVEKNERKAKEFYQKAADLGDENAKEALSEF